MPLDELRKKIDFLDNELLRLLNERAEVVHGIGEAKKSAGIMIYAPEREEALLQALAKKTRIWRDVCRRNPSAPFTGRSCPPPSLWRTI